jgi:predicted histidine transporter YuiF (NhaC family)
MNRSAFFQSSAAEDPIDPFLQMIHSVLYFLITSELRKNKSLSMRYILNTKRIVGLVLLICGVVLILFSSYIKHRVMEGRGQIADAEKKKEQADSLFSLDPATKVIGKAVTGSVEGKIQEGQEEADRYDKLAGWLQIGGIVCIVAGVAFVIFGRKKGR